MSIKNIGEFPKFQRILGLDVGERFIGVAVSDINQSISSPHTTIERRKFSLLINDIKALISENEAGGIVFGLPINMDGEEGPNCQSIRQFANNILKELDIAVYFQDERMSTIAVDRMMLEADLSRQKRKERKDKLAACYILQSAIDMI